MSALPALNNKTPLEAVRNADGREMVEALIGQFERDSSRMPVPPDSTVFINLRRRLVAVGRLLESQKEGNEPWNAQIDVESLPVQAASAADDLDGPDIAGGCVRELAIAPEDRIAFHMDKFPFLLRRARQLFTVTAEQAWWSARPYA